MTNVLSDNSYNGFLSERLRDDFPINERTTNKRHYFIEDEVIICTFCKVSMQL
jgi:hypothetical protein